MEHRKQLLEALNKERLKYKYSVIRSLLPGFLMSLATVGFFIGVNGIVPLNPLVFIFPVSFTLAFVILLVRTFILL